jgi:hypothetical protein
MALSCRAGVGGTSGYHLASFLVLPVSYFLLVSLLLCNVVFQSIYPAPKAIHVLLVLNDAVLCFFCVGDLLRYVRLAPRPTETTPCHSQTR